MKNNILITGADGFIGRNLINNLKNNNIYSIDINKSNFLDEKTTFLNIDLTKKFELKESFDYIFHLAAFPDSSINLENINKLIKLNIIGTLNLINSLKNFESFVHIGSYKQYGNLPVPYKEEQTNPITPYAISKDATEKFLRLLNLPIVFVRLSPSYGPFQKPPQLIPSIIESCLNGNELNLTKGEQKRELTYVEDITSALIKSALIKPKEILNIGYGKEYSIKEIVEKIIKLTNSSIVPNFGALPYRKNEVFRMLGDNSKTKKILNWQPKFDLEEGLKKTIEWY